MGIAAGIICRMLLRGRGEKNGEIRASVQGFRRRGAGEDMRIMHRSCRMRRAGHQCGHGSRGCRSPSLRHNGSGSSGDLQSQSSVRLLRRGARRRPETEGACAFGMDPQHRSGDRCAGSCGPFLEGHRGYVRRMRCTRGLSGLHRRQDGSQPLCGGIREASGPWRNRRLLRGAGGLHPRSHTVSEVHDGGHPRAEEDPCVHRRRGFHGRLHGGGGGSQIDYWKDGDRRILPLDGSGDLEVPEDKLREGSGLPRLRLPPIRRRGAC